MSSVVGTLKDPRPINTQSLYRNSGLKGNRGLLDQILSGNGHDITSHRQLDSVVRFSAGRKVKRLVG